MNKNELKAFVRYDYSGRIVPGSVIFRKKMPKNGRWAELAAHECCLTTTTTTIIIP